EAAMHVVGVQRPERLHERVLCQLLCLRRVAHHANDDAEHGPLVTLHYQAKCGIRAVKGPTNQLSICGSHSLLVLRKTASGGCKRLTTHVEPASSNETG